MISKKKLKVNPIKEDSDKNKQKIIGFVGFQQEDLSIWCGVFLSGMSKKILIMDFTTEQSLGYIFPLPEGYARIKDTEFDYKGIGFVNANNDTRIEDFASGYDMVIADFGKKTNHPDLKHCDALYAVTNLEMRNIECLRSLNMYENQFLIIRDFIRGSKMDLIVREELGYEKDQVFLFERNETEYRQFVHSQWSQEMVIHKISDETKELLLHIAKQMNLDSKACQMVLKSAMKGKVSGW